MNNFLCFGDVEVGLSFSVRSPVEHSRDGLARFWPAAAADASLSSISS